MTNSKSLKVVSPVYDDLNALKIRLAVTLVNRIPSISEIIENLITVGSNHYDELVTTLRGENETQ
jgi:hypothetical protein